MAISIPVSIRSIDGTVRIQWVSFVPYFLSSIELIDIPSKAATDDQNEKPMSLTRSVSVSYFPLVDGYQSRLATRAIPILPKTLCCGGGGDDDDSDGTCAQLPLWILCEALMEALILISVFSSYSSFRRCRAIVTLPIDCRFSMFCCFYALHFACARSPRVLFCSYKRDARV